LAAQNAHFSLNKRNKAENKVLLATGVWEKRAAKRLFPTPCDARMFRYPRKLAACRDPASRNRQSNAIPNVVGRFFRGKSERPNEEPGSGSGNLFGRPRVRAS
jgi:hypothetical protein